MRLKYLLRSGSLQFARDHERAVAPGTLASYVWNGHQVWYRPGSSDTELIYKILLKRGRKGEYAIDPTVRAALGTPRTVLDIGANIGVSTLFLAGLFPEARIFAFEPVPDNYALLARNTSHHARVQALPVALGERDGEVRIFHSDQGANFGGFSRFEAGSDVSRSVAVPMRDARAQFAELAITGADVVKIDVEGSEWEVLASLGPDFLRQTKFIMGELHGRRDFELLGLLSEHFRIAVKKKLEDRCYMFQALQRGL